MPEVSLNISPSFIPSLNIAPFFSFIPSQASDDAGDGDMGNLGIGYDSRKGYTVVLYKYFFFYLVTKKQKFDVLFCRPQKTTDFS